MTYIHRSLARRDFLRQATRLSALAGTPFALNLLAAGAASAQTAGDHKALVCIFLAGGNDQSNTVVPRSGGGYNSYQQGRPSLALPAANLLAINPTGKMPALRGGDVVVTGAAAMPRRWMRWKRRRGRMQSMTRK